MIFSPVRPITPEAINILQKRYFMPGETTWEDVATRVVGHVYPGKTEELSTDERNTLDMVRNRYFIPNSPALFNAGRKDTPGGLIACFVVDMKDSIEHIYKTKLNFARIAKKGGGCGTTGTHLRPEGSIVDGSTHGYAGGPVKFMNTICHDMEAMTQSGFRQMAMMLTLSCYHPDILKFIRAKSTEGVMSTTNISVMVDDRFMEAVVNDWPYQTHFNGMVYETLSAKEVFDEIVDGAWRNGEPGLLFYDTINNTSPYRYSNQVIYATNPCGEQPLPPNGCCNLGSLDVSKFITDNKFDYGKLGYATKLACRFLNMIISLNSYPNRKIERWAKENRPIGLGIMGFADLCLELGIVYGKQESLNLLEAILSFMYKTAIAESVMMGREYGIPKQCRTLPEPRHNMTVLTVAPTGTISLLAGCSSGIEPIFSELTVRQDKTGIYHLLHPEHNQPHFRCAVSTNGSRQVTWLEHVAVQAVAQRHVDSGVSKTINLPNTATREDIAKAFIMAWQEHCKGITVYRNGARSLEVLSPKSLAKDRCPLCTQELVSESGCKRCLNCDYSMCEIG